MRSEAIEDYLKAIYEIQMIDGRAKTSTLAARLGITAGSVTEMVKRLAQTRPKLITHTHHKGVVLTPAGKKAALKVIRRHRLLETFLHQTLGYGWDEVHEEAERLEHYVSDRLIESVAKYLHHPKHDPHGDPIPQKNGQLKETKRPALSVIPEGQTVRIIQVRHNNTELLHYLDKIGIRPKARVTILEKAPFNGPMALRVGQGKNSTTQSLAIHIAKGIFVESMAEI